MSTVGLYLARRLEELGITEYFAIPGDYNLVLLDELLKNKSVQMINCCNELNAGYAADGYARVKGISALIVTYGVGGLSAVNAVAGAYAEYYPIIVISGGPNTNSVQDSEILHHTTATENHHYVRDIYAQITAQSVIIHRAVDAPMQIDTAIGIALETKRPVYLEIACNLANQTTSEPTPWAFHPRRSSDASSLKAALTAVAGVLNKAVKPVLVVGSKVRHTGAAPLIEALSTSTGYGLAAMPDAKGFVSEQHPNYMGLYWGPVSSPGCAEIVESSDVYFFIGPNFNDYTTVGHVCNIQPNKLITIADGSLTCFGNTYPNVLMQEFLQGLRRLLTFNDASYKAYQRIARPVLDNHPVGGGNNPVSTRFLFAQIQALLSPEYCVLAETGDSWFNGLFLQLPEGCPFEIQMQYGSIGWSVGAVLGVQTALHHQKRVIGLIGDGSFQMSAQEVSTMIRYGLKPIIFLMNNGAYSIEVQIHDGPYNVLNPWHYAQLVEVFNGASCQALSFKVFTEQDLLAAVRAAKEADSLCFIEVVLDRDDCNKHLLEWGARVATYNSRPPR